MTRLGRHERWLHVACTVTGLLGCSTPPTALGPARPLTVNTLMPRSTEATDWRRTVPPAGTAGHVDFPVPTVVRLNNGIQVYHLERESGPVTLSVVIAHGAADERENDSGVAALTAALMTEATRKHRHDVLSELAESLGSSLTGETNRDWMRIALDCLPEDLETAIELLSEVVTEPAFDREDFDRIKRQALDSLRAERQSPARLASLIGLRALLGPDLGNPVTGCPQSVKSLNPADIRRWHETWVTPASTALLVVGPVSQSKLQPLAERLLGKWKAPTHAPPKVPAPRGPSTASGVYVFDQPGSVQTAIFTGQPFPKRHEPGEYARQHLDQIIGGLFTSRINRNLREDHAYTYGANSTLVAAKTFGLFAVTTSVATDVTVPALLELSKEFAAIVGPVPPAPEEVRRSRAALLHGLGSHLESSHRLLADLEQLFVYDDPPRYFADYPDRITSVGQAEIVAEASRLLPRPPVVVVVGDARSLRQPLTEAGLAPLDASMDCLEN